MSRGVALHPPNRPQKRPCRTYLPTPHVTVSTSTARGVAENVLAKMDRATRGCRSYTHTNRATLCHCAFGETVVAPRGWEFSRCRFLSFLSLILRTLLLSKKLKIRKDFCPFWTTNFLKRQRKLQNNHKILKFWRVTIRGAQPSARLSEEIWLSEGFQGPLRGSLRGFRGVSVGLCGVCGIFRNVATLSLWVWGTVGQEIPCSKFTKEIPKTRNERTRRRRSTIAASIVVLFCAGLRGFRPRRSCDNTRLLEGFLESSLKEVLLRRVLRRHLVRVSVGTGVLRREHFIEGA